DREFAVPALQQAHGRRHVPGLVDVDADQAIGADAVAQGLQHGLFPALVDAGLDVVGAVALRHAVLGLLRDLLRRAPLHVVEVVDLLAHGATEQAVERLAAGLAAGIPQRHVDAGEGEVRGHGLEGPDGVDGELALHDLAVPGAAADDERRHGVDGALDARYVSGARAFAPADDAVLGGDLHQHVGHATARDQRAGLDALVGDADGDGFELDDFHGSPLRWFSRSSVNS